MTFKDRVTKQRLTVDNAEITRIGEHEYRALLAHERDRRSQRQPEDQ